MPALLVFPVVTFTHFDPDLRWSSTSRDFFGGMTPEMVTDSPTIPAATVEVIVPLAACAAGAIPRQRHNAITPTSSVRMTTNGDAVDKGPLSEQPTGSTDERTAAGSMSGVSQRSICATHYWDILSPEPPTHHWRVAFLTQMARDQVFPGSGRPHPRLPAARRREAARLARDSGWI